MRFLVAIVVLAWVAIALLGLAVGGLIAKVSRLETRIDPRPARHDKVVPRVVGDHGPIDLIDTSVLFVDSSCSVCKDALRYLAPYIDDAKLVIVTNEVRASLPALPPKAASVEDPDAIERSGVPAVPWFVVIDSNGETSASFALGSPEALNRALEHIRPPVQVPRH